MFKPTSTFYTAFSINLLTLPEKEIRLIISVSDAQKYSYVNLKGKVVVSINFVRSLAHAVLTLCRYFLIFLIIISSIIIIITLLLLIITFSPFKPVRPSLPSRPAPSTTWA